jgi:hypothetical protein
MKPSENTSFEVYYQYDWEETQIDPVGSYFSTTDLAGGGAEKVMLGFGSAPDTIPVGARIPGNPIGSVVPRGATRDADESNQYGAAFRWFVPALGGTDFGFYYMKYNSRLPVIMAHTGTAAGLLVNGNYAGSAYYFLEYPEDISLYGISFNSQLGGGVALQGEISHRLDVPLQVDDIELSAPPVAAAQSAADPAARSGARTRHAAREQQPARRLRFQRGDPGLPAFRYHAGADHRHQGVQPSARSRPVHRRGGRRVEHRA